ncbi:hypothetical protein BGW37DRAFT_508908 [Umbelopsis sp. PMI_123]|nr:hypothetical protein BGW37DRAFT_508908 [Umbelopsis sp. PMI_123]
MHFKLASILSIAALAVSVAAKCDCSNNDMSCQQRCSQQAQECIQKCQYDSPGDNDCQRECANDYLPDNARGYAQGGGSYGNIPQQGGYNGQSLGQPYGAGHWQNGQWISGASGKSVQMALPALAAVAVGMLAL